MMLNSLQCATRTFALVFLIVVTILLNESECVSSQVSSDNVDQAHLISNNNKVKRLTVPLNGNMNIWTQQHPNYYDIPYVIPRWQVGSKLIGEGIEGMIAFQPLPYSSHIRVILNATGLPPGKHALHIHTYGDMGDGCTSTGEQFPNNFLGNVNAKEDGSVSVAFISPFLNLFGFHGIVGRSIIIHEKPIDLNTILNAEIISSGLPDALASQNEEKSVGAAIACGVITVLQQQQQQTEQKD
ncbi:sodesque isoform 2-T2 [Glossina fuscipes fuscipes]